MAWAAKPYGTHVGHSSKERDARRAAKAAKAARTIEEIQALHPSIGAPQPKGDQNWHPLAQSWWKAIGMSRSAQVFQPVDWMNLYIAAVVLDQMCNFGFTPSLYQVWARTCERHQVPLVDMLPAPADEAEAEPGDADEAEADAGIGELATELRLVE